MARRRCILHIGSPRTGSTSIQNTLKTNSRELLEQGFLVPTKGQAGKGVHPSLAYALAGMPGQANWVSAEASFLRELEAANPHTVLVSAEILWRVMVLEDRLAHLVGRLRQLDFDIALLCYVRNQPQFLNSSYTRSVRSFLHARPFDRFVRSQIRKGRRSTYTHRLEAARQHGIDFIARPFNEEVRKGGVVEDYLRAVGATLPEAARGDVQLNQSVGPFHVDLARRLFRHAFGDGTPSSEQSRACARALENGLKKSAPSEASYCGLSGALAREIEAAHREDNDRFAAYTWGRPWSEVFASDMGREHPTNDYDVTGVPPDRQPLLQELMHALAPRLARLAS